MYSYSLHINIIASYCFQVYQSWSVLKPVNLQLYSAKLWLCRVRVRVIYQKIVIVNFKSMQLLLNYFMLAHK